MVTSLGGTLTEAVSRWEGPKGGGGAGGEDVVRLVTRQDAGGKPGDVFVTSRSLQDGGASLWEEVSLERAGAEVSHVLNANE